MCDQEKKIKKRGCVKMSKRKVDTTAPEYWIVHHICEDAVIVTFVPYDAFEIDLAGDIYAQTRTHMNAMYEADEDAYEQYDHYDIADDAEAITRFTQEHHCVTLAYGDE